MPWHGAVSYVRRVSASRAHAFALHAWRRGGEELDDTCISWRTMERASSCVWIEEGELGEREGERRGEYK